MRHPGEPHVTPPLRAPLIAMAIVSLASAGVAQIAESEPMPAAKFNRQVAQAHARGETWAVSARSVALKFVGDGCCRSRVVQEGNAQGRSRTDLTITDQGAKDDSVCGYRFRVTLQMGSEGSWQIVDAGRSWNCWPGRGHQGFSTASCN
jgi:hypothetical protein